MLDKNDYNLLLSIEASCKVMLNEIQKLRAKAEAEYNPKPKKRKKTGLTEDQIARLLAQREKTRIRGRKKWLQQHPEDRQPGETL